MATPKKTKEAKIVRADEFATAAQKLARTRKAPAAEATAATETKKATQKSSAATHKAPARKSVPAAIVSEPAVIAPFDIALHEEEIRKEAYYSWISKGCPQDSEHEDWLAAIEIVQTRRQS